MRTSHFLFLGYGMRDWNLRVILRHIWSEQARRRLVGDQLAPGEIDQRFWARNGVDIIDAPLEEWVDTMRASSGDRASPAPSRDERRSPFQGVVPYGEADADWFFGRREWTEIIIDNLARLPALDPLRRERRRQELRPERGRHPGLRVLAASNLATRASPELVAVPFSSWSSERPVAATKEAVRQAVERRPRSRPAPADRSAHGHLRRVGDAIGGPVLVVLDQFEDYFLYHPHDEGPNSFQEELSLALRRRRTPANFILSIREDALRGSTASSPRPRPPREPAPHRPPRPDGRAGGDRTAARAVEPHIRACRQSRSSRRSSTPSSTRSRPGRCSWATASPHASSADGGEGRIEAPYLQLVLSRLWAEERSLASRLLRLQTLEHLGGAERIVRTHLDATMAGLRRTEQDVAARAFRNLVTPSGTKIAHRADDLAELTDVPSARLEPVLAQLAGEVRILRPAGDGAYEIYHDALAGPILHWRAAWQERRGAVASGGGSRCSFRRLVLMLVAAGFLALFVTAREARDDARAARDDARSRELASRAGAALGSDPQESLRLAQAVSSAATAQAVSALRAALAEANALAVLRGHKGPVTGAAFSPGGERVVTSSDGGTGRIWDARSGRSLHVLRGHEGRTLSTAFSPDGRLVLTAGRDGTARLWDAARPAPCASSAATGRVLAAAFSADGGRVVTASLDRTAARIWDARSGRRLHVLPCRSVRPQRRLQRRRYACRRPAKTRPRASGTPATAARSTFCAATAAPCGAPSSAPAARLAAAGRDPGGAGLGRPRESRRRARGHTGSVSRVSFSRDGRRVVTAGDDGGADLGRAAAAALVLRGHTDAIRAAAGPTGGSSSRQATTGRGGSGTRPAGRASGAAWPRASVAGAAFQLGRRAS